MCPPSGCARTCSPHRPGPSPRSPSTPIFASLPGVGDVLTGTLLAEIGEDRARFPTPAVLLAEAGLAPVTRASGRSRKVRFRYAANTILREAAMWWAYNSMKEAPWAKAAFRDARDRPGQHPAGRDLQSSPRPRAELDERDTEAVSAGRGRLLGRVLVLSADLQRWCGQSRRCGECAVRVGVDGLRRHAVAGVSRGTFPRCPPLCPILA